MTPTRDTTCALGRSELTTLDLTVMFNRRSLADLFSAPARRIECWEERLVCQKNGSAHESPRWRKAHERSYHNSGATAQGEGRFQLSAADV